MHIETTILRVLSRLAAAAVVGVAGCTSVTPAAPAFDAVPELPAGYHLSEAADADGQVSIEGWWLVRGEFQLYPNRRDLGELYNRRCISGRLMDDQLNRDSRQYDRRRVRVHGWLHRYGSEEFDVAPPYIENYCSSDQVFYAVRYELLDQVPGYPWDVEAGVRERTGASRSGIDHVDKIVELLAGAMGGGAVIYFLRPKARSFPRYVYFFLIYAVTFLAIAGVAHLFQHS